MNINEYLESLITNTSEYELTQEDEKKIRHEGIEVFIFNKLNSSKYKASATEDDYLQKIKSKISLSVMHDMPIHITLPFGAAKNPYLPTAPGIDWAEVCNIAYLRDYLSPIAKAYKYGVILEYISVAVFEEKVNRIPKKDTDLYDKEFSRLVDFYKKYLPKNFTLSYSRVEDSIPREKINHQIGLKMEELRKLWNKQSPEVIEYKLKRSARNSIFDPNDKNKEKLIIDSALGHDAFCSECWTLDAAPWDKKDMIVLGHNYTSGWAIHVRSTAGSSVNFWSGMGAIIEKNNHFTPTVLSPKQLEEVKEKMKQEKVNIFQDEYKNLSQINII